MLGKRKLKSVTAPKARAVPQRVAIPFGIMVRMFLIGSVAVVASIYAIYRHYTVPYQKMLVPTPSATEIEIDVPPN